MVGSKKLLTTLALSIVLAVLGNSKPNANTYAKANVDVNVDVHVKVKSYPNQDANGTGTVVPVDTVVVVVVDDLGHADLGYAGSGIATPIIDSLAYGGVRLDQYHVYRACTPTRAALLTSR